MKMETKLENIVDSMMQSENVVGALIADSQGLAYACEIFIKIKKYLNLKITKIASSSRNCELKCFRCRDCNR